MATFRASTSADTHTQLNSWPYCTRHLHAHRVPQIAGRLGVVYKWTRRCKVCFVTHSQEQKIKFFTYFCVCRHPKLNAPVSWLKTDSYCSYDSGQSSRNVAAAYVLAFKTPSNKLPWLPSQQALATGGCRRL